MTTRTPSIENTCVSTVVVTTVPHPEPPVSTGTRTKTTITPFYRVVVPLLTQVSETIVTVSSQVCVCVLGYTFPSVPDRYMYVSSFRYFPTGTHSHTTVSSYTLRRHSLSTSTRVQTTVPGAATSRSYQSTTDGRVLNPTPRDLRDSDL